MDFIKITEEGIFIDDSSWSEQNILENFQSLIEKVGFDDKRVACGVSPSPDFGYFQLADRFWRSSLVIYFGGVTGCYWERGAGYAEPWLFNARHSIELYLKGFLLYYIWFQELHRDLLSPGDRVSFSNLRTHFKKPHCLSTIYNDYQSRLQNVLSKWNIREIGDCPKIEKMLLTQAGEEILKELDEVDKNSFRFRYPSISKDRQDHLQKLGWQYDDSELLSKTGLPKNSGIFFDHITVVNNLHKLVSEIKSVESYLDACWDYIGEIQDIALDLEREFQEYYSE